MSQTLILKTADGDRSLEFSPGESLRDILDATSYRVRSGCRGTGACGLCRVKIGSEEPNEPTQAESLYLSEGQIASGVRLACQVRPRANMEVTILNEDTPSVWKALPHSLHFPPPYPKGREDRVGLELPEEIEHPCGVAVDLGTTHISVSFHDLLTGRRFAGRYGPNPQAEHGSDVVSRLSAACESEQLARIMRAQALDAIGSAIADVAAREGVGMEQVVRIALVGNTAMLALLSGRNYRLLLQPSYWMSPIDCLPEDPRELSAIWGIHPESIVKVLPPLAGFVGSDLLAGCAATGLTEGGPGTLLIDFGTNSEIALWDGNVLWVTSAAGGPAFEGCGLTCGMPAEPGAIYQVRETMNTGNSPSLPSGSAPSANGTKGFPGLGLHYRTIDDKEPAGFCGSGIVDLIACLVRSGKLTDIGRFANGSSTNRLVLLEAERQLALTRNDVDVFQRAKAAINAAVRVLLSKARLSCGDLRRVYVSGAFGRFLDHESAKSVGLLPDLDRDAIQVCGNTALSGCQHLLFSVDPGQILDRLAKKAKIINLAHFEDFDDFFLEGLYLNRWAST